MPILSVIIPVYNGASFIEPLVASLTKHSFKDVEYVFIDNNSTDDSKALLKTCLEPTALQYQLLDEVQQGPGYARNKGISAAKGTYIAFLDCDDQVHPEKYATDIDIFLAHDPDFVFCRAKRHYWDGRELVHPIDGIRTGLNSPPELGMVWLRNFFKLQGTGAIMVKKDILEELGGFHTSMTGEDAFLFIKLGLLFNGYFYDEVNFQYNRHPTSLISKSNSELKTSILRYLELRMNLYFDSDIKNNQKAIKLLDLQINIDLLKLHRMGIDVTVYLGDNRLSGFERQFLLFNKLSLFFNRRIRHIKYNPFFQIWNRFLISAPNG